MTELKKERYWSKYAHTYDDYTEYVIGRTIRQTIIKRLSEEHDLGETIEFGCGTGYFTKAIAKNVKHVTATDLSDEMLEIAKMQLEEFQNVTIQKADCEGTFYSSEAFDTVFMANVIHTIENPLKALQESYRILKNEGLLLIVSYTDYGMNWLEKIELGIRYLAKFGMPPPYGLRNYSPDELKSTVKNAGFKVEEIELIGEKPKALYLKGRKKKETLLSTT